jgi:hypothetical protein
VTIKPINWKTSLLFVLLFVSPNQRAFAEDPAPTPSATPLGPHEQYAIIWGGGKKPADSARALKGFEKDFTIFKGRFQGVDGYPMPISGGRIKGLDSDNEVLLLGYCNDEQVKAAIAFYKSFHPSAYAKKIWSDWDNDRCPYPAGLDVLQVGARKKAGKLTFNVVAYGPMTVAYLWSSKDELLQSKVLEVPEANDLTQDIDCHLSLDLAHSDEVLANCEARRTHTGGIASLAGHFKVSSDSGKLRSSWKVDKKTMDSEE